MNGNCRRLVVQQWRLLANPLRWHFGQRPLGNTKRLCDDEMTNREKWKKKCEQVQEAGFYLVCGPKRRRL